MSKNRKGPLAACLGQSRELGGLIEFVILQWFKQLVECLAFVAKIIGLLHVVISLHRCSGKGCLCPDKPHQKLPNLTRKRDP